MLAGTTLIFDPSYWTRPQVFRLQAAEDADTSDDTATVTVSAPGLSDEPISVSVLDLLTDGDAIFAHGLES